MIHTYYIYIYIYTYIHHNAACATGASGGEEGCGRMHLPTMIVTVMNRNGKTTYYYYYYYYYYY